MRSLVVAAVVVGLAAGCGGEADPEVEAPANSATTPDATSAEPTNEEPGLDLGEACVAIGDALPADGGILAGGDEWTTFAENLYAVHAGAGPDAAADLEPVVVAVHTITANSIGTPSLDELTASMRQTGRMFRLLTRTCRGAA